jgi:orotidine-5'-phosphate decarboxylase
MGADGLTISPYMGSDSIQPFLEFDNKWAIVLGLTSNVGSKDFELLKIDGDSLYEVVLKSCSQWGNIHNMMFVIGATQPAYMQSIRNLLPNHFFLVPGVGAQGGSLEDVCRNLISDEIGILVNSSREIIFASSAEDYASKAGEKAREIRQRMEIYI